MSRPFTPSNKDGVHQANALSWALELKDGKYYLSTLPASLVPEVYDYISLSYTGSNLTGVVFKVGGAGGTTVATLTLAYVGSDLVSVTKT